MKPKHFKRNSRENAEKAACVLKGICERAFVSHENRYLEGLIRSNRNDELKVKNTLDAIATIFGCKYSLDWNYIESPDSIEQDMFVEPYEFYIYKFLPKRITDYEIRIKVKQSMRYI